MLKCTVTERSDFLYYLIWLIWFKNIRGTKYDPDTSGRFSNYNAFPSREGLGVCYMIYDIRSTIKGRINLKKSVQGKLLKWTVTERSNFSYYLTWLICSKLNTKSTKSFGKLRMTAQSLTKNVAIEYWKCNNSCK